MESKKFWLDLAEVLDAYRIMPRIVLALVLGFAGMYIYDVSSWYMMLPTVERTVEVSGFAGITIPAVFGLAGKLIDWYLKTGRAWKKSEEE